MVSRRTVLSVIGYYVHHHGRGHAARALAISAHVDEEIVFYSSLPRPARVRPCHRWVRLPLDVPADPGEVRDADANGLLHWAPLGVDGLLHRSARMLDDIDRNRVRRLVVDVSVEVAVLARSAGVPVTVLAMPGDRADAAHQLAYGLAEQIVAPWSEDLYRPEWLAHHADRTHYVGAISRFDGDARTTRKVKGDNAVMLLGAGGADVPDDALGQLRAALPRYRWTSLGGASWTDDPWTALASAAVIVTHAGQSALADAALSGAAAIVLPQDRPYREQHASARALADAGVAVAVDGWPPIVRWRSLFDEALGLDRERWSRLRVAGAAARAARVITA